MRDRNKDLKDFFRTNGINQAEISKRLNKSQALVNRLLNGKPFGKRTAMELAEAFGLNPMWLMTGEGDMLLDNTGTIKTNALQIGEQNTLVQTESERLLSLLEKKEEQIQQRDRQIDELIAMLKQQMNK